MPKNKRFIVSMTETVYYQEKGIWAATAERAKEIYKQAWERGEIDPNDSDTPIWNVKEDKDTL